MTTNRHQLTKTSCCIALYLCATTLVAVLCLAAAVATMLGAAEKHYIAQGIQQNIRLDGRTCSDFRPIELQLGVVEQASGSARLRMGATDVIVGVKVTAGLLAPP